MGGAVIRRCVVHLSGRCGVIDRWSRIGHRSWMRQAGIMRGRATKILGAQATRYSTGLRNWSQRSISNSPQTGVLTARKQDVKEILDNNSVVYILQHTTFKRSTTVTYFIYLSGAFSCTHKWENIYEACGTKKDRIFNHWETFLYRYCFMEENADPELELGGEGWPIGTMLEWEDICWLDQFSWVGNIDKQAEGFSE